MNKSKSFQELNLVDGFMFGASTENPENAKFIAKLIIERATGKKVKKVTVSQEKPLLGVDVGYHGIRMDLYVTEYENRVEISWFGKKPCRLPQAFWCKFKGYNEKWEIEKMGKWINPEKIVSSNLICGFDRGVRNDEYEIYSLDAGLCAPFGKHLLRYGIKTDKQDMYFNLYNNIWNTNFPMWYSDDSVFRFEIVKR